MTTPTQPPPTMNNAPQGPQSAPTSAQQPTIAYASAKGGKWHMVNYGDMPTFRQRLTVRCGATFEPHNMAVEGDLPTSDDYICQRCWTAARHPA